MADPLPKISKVEAPGQGRTLSMLTGQQGQSKYDVGQSPYQQQNKLTNRAEQQSNWRAFANSLQQSVVGEILGGALQSAGSIVDAVSGRDYANPGTLFQWGSQLQKSQRENAPIYVDPANNDMGNMEWWLQGLPNIATSAAMLIPGLAVAKGVGAVGKALRASEFATSLAERGLGALAMRHAENAMEAYQNRQSVYDDLLNRGYDADRATVAADYAGSLTYKMNYGNLLFDFIQLSAIMKPLKGVKFAQGKNLGVVDRMKAVNDAGFKVANRAIQDFGSKGILDGLKWWEKSLVYGTRFASPIIAQGTEGIEELVNNFSQQEGVYQANKIARGEAPDKPVWEGGDKEFMNRAIDSVQSKSGKESFFWGVLGGVAFNKVGQLANMAMDPEHRSQQAMQIANLDNRKNVISEALKVMADPEATSSEKREAQFSMVFDLSRQSVISGNDEALIDALQSKEYRDILKNETGITDDTLLQKKMDEITEDVRFIQDSYSKFVGKDMKALRQTQEQMNMNMFGVESKTDSLGEQPDVQDLATPEHLYFNWLSNSRLATDYMVQLDYFAHKNDHLNKEANLELEKLLSDTFGGENMASKNAAKAYYRQAGVLLNIENNKAKLKQAKKANNSKDKIAHIESNIKGLQDIANRYEKIYNEQLQQMREDAATNLFGQGDYSEKTDSEKELSAGLAEGDFLVKRDSIRDEGVNMNFNIVGRNVDKQTYAYERAKAVADPLAWHKEFQDNNKKIEAFIAEEKRLNEEFGVLPEDTQETRDFKIEIGTLAKSEDPESEAVKSYRDAYGNYRQFDKDEQFTVTADALQTELQKFDFTKPADFDRTNYLKLKGQQRAIIQAKAEFDAKNAAAAAATAATAAAPGTTQRGPTSPVITKGKSKIPATHKNIVKLSQLNEFSIAVFAVGQPDLEVYDPATDLRVDGAMVVAKEDVELLDKFKLAHPQHYTDLLRVLEIGNQNGVVDADGKPVSITSLKLDPSTIDTITLPGGGTKRDITGALKKLFEPVLDHIQDLKDKGTLAENEDMVEFDALFNKGFTGLTNRAFAGLYDTMQNALESIAKLSEFSPTELIDTYIAFSPEIKTEIERVFEGLPMETYDDFFNNRSTALTKLSDIYRQLNNDDAAVVENVTARVDAPLLIQSEQVIEGEVENLNNTDLQGTNADEKTGTIEQLIVSEASNGSTQLEKLGNNGQIQMQTNQQARIDTPYSIFTKMENGMPAQWSEDKFKVPFLWNGVDNYNYDKWAHVGGDHYLKPDDDIKLVRTGKTRTKNLKGTVSEEYEVVDVYKVAPDGTEIYIGPLPYMSEVEHREDGWKIKDIKRRDDVRNLYVNIRKLFPESGILYAKASPMKIGDLIFNYAQIQDKKKSYDYGTLSQSFQLENMNQRYDPKKSNVYLTVMRQVGVEGSALQVMRGAGYINFDKTPNGENIHVLTRSEYNKQKYVGQTFALVPTNTMYQGKHVYYSVLLSGRSLGDFNPVKGKHAGKNIVEAILDAVINPTANEELIRDLSSKLGGIGFKADKPLLEQRKALVDFFELVPSMIGRIVYANIQPSEHGSAKEYVYPFRISYLNPETIKKQREKNKLMNLKMEKGGIDNLYGSFVMETRGGEKAFQTVGEPLGEKWKFVAAIAKPILDAKPLRVDNSYVSHNVNSGPYNIPFFDDKGNLTVQTFDSYLHYLNEKGVIKSIVQGVDISGKRFYFTPSVPYFRGVSQTTATNYSPTPNVIKIKPEDENPINNLFGEAPTFKETIGTTVRAAEEEKKEEAATAVPAITPVPIVVTTEVVKTEEPAPVKPVPISAEQQAEAEKERKEEQKKQEAAAAQQVKDLMAEKEEIERALADDKKRKEAEQNVTAAMADLTTEENDTVASVFEANKKPDETLESFITTAIVNEHNNVAPYKGDKSLIAKFREILRKIMKTFLMIGAIGTIYVGSSSLVVPKNAKISAPTAFHIDLSQADSIQNTIGKYHGEIYTNTPYVILDKKTREMYVYDSSGQSVYKGPALIGATAGKDTLTTGTMRHFSDFTDKVTPSGEFKLNREADSTYGTKYAFAMTDPDGKRVKPSEQFVIAFHSTSQLPDRLAALASPTGADNAMSFGCVSINKADFTRLESMLGEGSHIYILPDNANRALYESFLKARYANPKLTFKQHIENITKPASQVPGKSSLPIEASMLASMLAFIRKRKAENGEGDTFTDDDIKALEDRLKEINNTLAKQSKPDNEVIDKNSLMRDMAESEKIEPVQEKTLEEGELPFDPSKMFRKPDETDMNPLSNKTTTVEKFMDPYMFKYQPSTYNKLSNVATDILFNVLHAQRGDEVHLDKQVLKRRGMESLKQLIDKNRTFLTTQINDWKNDADPDKRVRYTEAETSLEYLKYLESTFDKDFMPKSVKNLVGSFEGYFNLAYDRLFAYKIVRFSHYVDDIVIEDDSYAMRVRHDDNWSAYINPKDTVLFRAKVFLSRIPQRNDNGDILYNEFGMPVYYSLDQMYNNIYAQPDKIRPREIAKSLVDDEQTNPVLRSIGQTLEEYKDTHPQQYEGMFNMLSSSLLLQRRDMMVSSAKVSEEGGLDIYLYNLNRQQLEEQLLNIWDENFKRLLPSYYEIEQKVNEVATEDTPAGVVVTQVHGLKEKELSTYTAVTRPMEVDHLSFINPEELLAEELNSNTINHSEFEDRRSDYKMEFLLRYFEELRKMMAKTTATVQLRIPTKVVLSNNVEVSKADIATLLRYLNIPKNVQLDAYTAAIVKPKDGEGSENYKTKLGSIVQGLNDVLMTPSVQNVSPQALFIAGHLMDRMGLQAHQDFKKTGRALYELSKNYGAKKNIDPKHPTDLKYILQSKVVKGIGNRLLKHDVLPNGQTSFKWLADSIENPFGRDRIAMRDIAKGLKSWWPNLVSINIINNDGESEYTVNFHTALSNMIARIRHDDTYRNSLMANPFVKNNPFLMTMIDPEQDLNEFGLQYNAGFKMGLKSYNVKSVNEYIYPAMAFTFFQHGEAAGQAGVRSMGRFLTQHGESHVTPSVRARKVQTDIKMRKAENGKISIVTHGDEQSPFYETAVGIFKNELNRVYLGQRIFEATQQILDTLIKNHPTTPRADLVRDAALTASKRYNAQEGYNFRIKGDQLLPGAAMKFTLFGKEMFNDSKKVIYKENGLLKDEFIVNGLVDSELAAERMLKAYLDDFLTEMVDNFIENNKEIGLFQLKETDDAVDENDKNLEYIYPLFDRKYVEHMRNLLRGRIHLTTKKSGKDLLEIEEWNGNEMNSYSLGNIGYSYNVKDTPEEQAAKKVEAEKGLQFEYRYMVADFLLNYFVFKSSYYQLMQDPATFQKSATYEDIKVESDKRLKHHLGPGSMTALQPDRRDDMRVIYKQDTYVHDMKVPINEVQVSKMQPHQQKALKYMMETFGKDGYFHKKGNTYYIPTQFGTLAAIHFAHRNSKNLEEIMRAYLTQRVDDGGAEITPREFLGRYVRTGEISREQAVKFLRVLEDEKSTPAQLIALRNEMPVVVMKMIYSDQNEVEMKDPETGKLHKIQLFSVLKNSESVMTPALVKGTEKYKIYQDLINMERDLLKKEGLGLDSFEFGIIHAPISNSKSSNPVALKTWNADGSYNGSVMRSYVQRLNREGLREQQDSVLKENNKITQSSQALPFSMLNVASNVYFGEDLGQLKIKVDELIMGDGLTAEEFIENKDGISNVQVSNVRTEIYDAQIRQDWMDVVVELGLAQNIAKGGRSRTKRESFLNGLYIRDAKKFLKVIGQQMITQFGANENVYPYLETVIEKDAIMRIPISETAFGKLAENVIMSKLSRIVSGRKTEGIPLIQATSSGFHVFDKAAGQIEEGSDLAGYDIETKVIEGKRFISPKAAEAAYPHNYYDAEEVREANGSVTYKAIIFKVTPAEIDISWNFRGKDGKLLKYEDYVDSKGKPLPGKFTKEMLEVIGYRIPNTGANTISYLKVRRFLPPSHADIVRVPPMLLTMMNADLDVDKLYLYTKTYQISDDGQVQDIPSVMHDSQPNASAIIFTDDNKKAFVNRILKAYNQEYRALSEKVAEMVLDNNVIRRAIERLVNYDQLTEDLEIVKSTTDAELATQVEQFPVLKERRDYLKKLIDLTNQVLAGNESILEQMINQLPNQYPGGVSDAGNIRRFKAAAKDDLIKFILPQMKQVEDTIDTIEKKAEVLGYAKDPRYKGLLESIDTTELDKATARMKEIFDAKYQSFDFTKGGLSSKGFTFYDVMNAEQLQNSMMDTFKLMFSSGSMLTKMTAPLNSDPIKNLAQDKTVTYYDNNGNVVKTSLAERNPIAQGFINDMGSSMQSKQGGKDNSDMISNMASFMRTLSLAQRGGFYLTTDERIPDGLIYGDVVKNKDGVYENATVADTPLIYGEDPVTANNSFYIKDAIAYENTNPIYNGRMRHADNGRWRLDAFFGKDIHGNQYEVPVIAASALQAALDGVKEVVNGFINLNPETANSFMVHVMLRHIDEGARIINTNVIKRYAREVLADKPDAELSKSTRMKNFVGALAMSSKMISEKGIDAIIAEFPDLDALGFASKILKAANYGKQKKVLTVADLNKHIGEDVGDITIKEGDMSHAKREFMILYNFMVSDDIGNQLLTVNQNLNTFNKGTDNNINDVLDKREDYWDMHRLTQRSDGKWEFSTTVPNIGGIYRL